MWREYYLPLVLVGVVFIPDKNPNYSDRLVYCHHSTIPDIPFVDWFGFVQKTNANDLEQPGLHETVCSLLVEIVRLTSSPIYSYPEPSVLSSIRL